MSLSSVVSYLKSEIVRTIDVRSAYEFSRENDSVILVKYKINWLR